MDTETGTQPPEGREICVEQPHTHTHNSFSSSRSKNSKTREKKRRQIHTPNTIYKVEVVIITTITFEIHIKMDIFRVVIFRFVRCERRREKEKERDDFWLSQPLE